MIDVIIVNYFSADLARAAVESIRAQQLELRVWIVDNSVEPAEWQRLQVFSAPDTTLVRARENLGFGRACNLAYAQGEAPYVLLLNPDARLAAGALALLAGTLDDDPRLGAAGPNIYWNRSGHTLLPPAELPTAARICARLALNALRLAGLRRYLFRRAMLRQLSARRPLRVAAFSGGGVLLRRAAVDRAGGLFDPRFFMFYEDSDLALRLHRAGQRMAVQPLAIAIHHYRRTAHKAVLGAQAEQEFWGKYWPGRAWQSVRRWLERRQPAPSRPDRSWGICADPWIWSVPAVWQSGWRFELAAVASGVPMAMWWGEGPELAFAPEDWALLEPGEYWGRLFPATGRFGGLSCHWIVSERRSATAAA